MKDFRKGLTCLVFTMTAVLCVAFTAGAETFTLRVSPSLRTSVATAADLEHVAWILGQHAGEPAGDTVTMYRTGITVPEGMDGDELAETYRRLMPSMDVVFFCTDEGRGNVTASATGNPDTTYFGYSRTGEGRGLWVGFRPNSDPAATVGEINASLAAARAVSGATPRVSDVETYSHLFAHIVNGSRYDRERRLSSYSAAAPLLRGNAVCQGFADAFALLCLYSGLECYIVTLPDINHVVNAVPADGGGVRIIDTSDACCRREEGLDPWSKFMMPADAGMTAYVKDFRSGMTVPRYR